MSSLLRFVPPAAPRRRDRPPSGSGWVHEVKFDGYRLQAIKHGCDVRLFSKNGFEFTSRFPTVAYLAQSIPARSAIIDAELVASDRGGQPDFYKLLTGRNEPADLTLWTFDILHLNGRDLVDQPLKARRARLQGLVQRADCPAVLFSESFADPQRLLEECEKRRL
jgi:bifunctional non-homologous end joining protein LigD